MRSRRKGCKNMKKMKRLVTLLLSLALLMTAVPVKAEENDPQGAGKASEVELIYPSGDLPEAQIYETDREVPNISTFAAAPYSTEAELYEFLEAEVKEALLEGKTEVDVSKYGIDSKTYKLYALSYFSPYLGMNMKINAYYSTQNYNYVYLGLNNQMSLQETKNYFAQVDEKVNEILSVVSDDMTDLEKALAIHDYFVYSAEYDYDNYLNNTIPSESYSSAGLFMKGTGVCNAYAYGYQYIMTKLGIECYVTSSDSMNHAWNIIKLNNKYYHVDCTWDDPVPDTKGRVLHSHFLASDSKMRNSLRHDGWDRTDLVCSDTSYDNAYWTNVTSQIINAEDKSYFIKNGYICSQYEGQTQEIIDLGIWPVWGGSGWWNSQYSGFFYKNGYLYYNTYSSIKRVLVTADGLGNPEIFYQPDLSEGYVYGSYLEGNEVKYIIKKTYSDDGIVYAAPVSTDVQAESIEISKTSADLVEGDTLQLTATVKPLNASVPVTWKSDNPSVATVDENGLVKTLKAGTAKITAQAGQVTASCNITVKALPYKLGDLNSDGNINVTDLRLVLRYICGKTELSNQQILAGDVVVDGKVNVEDLRMILRYICGKVSAF